MQFNTTPAQSLAQPQTGLLAHKKQYNLRVLYWRREVTVGTLRNDDGEGYENVT